MVACAFSSGLQHQNPRLPLHSQVFIRLPHDSNLKIFFNPQSAFTEIPQTRTTFIVRESQYNTRRRNDTFTADHEAPSPNGARKILTKGEVPISRPAFFETEKISAGFNQPVFLMTPKFCIEAVLHSLFGITHDQSLYTEISAKLNYPGFPRGRSESLWGYSGVWPSKDEVGSAFEETLQRQEWRRVMAAELEIKLEVVPLNKMRLHQLTKELENHNNELENQINQADKVLDLEQKVENQQVEIETMKQEMLKLKANLEARDRILGQIFQDHIIEGAKNH
ncbi:hypothetical protein V8F33_002174 [Rhypophila sp. PSN 637]